MTAVDLSNGVLKITGTPQPDTVIVSFGNNRISVSDNGQQSSYAAANVQRIEAFMKDGNDRFDALGVPRAVVARGENGADKLRSGTRPSSLYGGNGNDTLTAGPITGERPNRLFGNAGNDVLFGSSGHDVLQGHAGADKLTGAKNTDWLNPGLNDGAVDEIFAQDGEKLDRLIDVGQQDIVHKDLGVYAGGVRDSDFSGQTVINGKWVEMRRITYPGIEGIFYRVRTVADDGTVFVQDRRANGPINVFTPNPLIIDADLRAELVANNWLHVGIFG
jgi:Ca2+-binding RTX toxin-like protein